jgi:hemerythrin-like metal-binding protein
MEEKHVWNPRLELGNAEIDSEHHLQIAMIGALGEAIEQRRPTLARKLADQLAGYSAAHFEGEQLLMEASGYAHAAGHIEEHRAIMTHVNEISALVAGGEYDLALPMALDLLTGLGSHISTSDRAYAAYAAQQRSGANAQRSA